MPGNACAASVAYSGKQCGEQNGSGQDFPTVESCPEGYPMLAAFLSSDHNFMVYRGFNYLHARCLLYQQDELVALERELDEMDGEDNSKGEKEREKRSLRSRDLDDARAGQPRKALLKEIKDKLSEYDEFISKAKNIASLQQPSKRDYQSVRRWFKNRQPLVDEEQDFIRCKEDLIALRHGRECAGFDGLVERMVQKMNCRLISGDVQTQLSQEPEVVSGVSWSLDGVHAAVFGRHERADQGEKT
ncbi:hypothetical protein FGG08_006476 [Glutinoglossum americanum]|uniref:DUF6594 domain-containing protein n=1 Tax=Glutinoglossum americanum TaxID=1670608 RepID=A0A9P8I177_9PEZI|nr:hypothetical protein FGG08_006476 [Glutinoglossum americanum]